MSAQVLRDAAELMRWRAKAARAGRWVADGDGVVACWSLGDVEVAVCRGSIDEGNVANAEHVASWHPAVALAVADWLDEQAIAHEANERIWSVSSLDPKNRWEERGLTVEANLEHHHRHALTVARAYLGSAS